VAVAKTMSLAEPDLRRIRSADGAVELAAWCYGDPHSNAACLLLHGNGLPARCYEPVIRTLCAAGLYVVALDQRGSGHSPLPRHGRADLHWSHFGDDVLAVIKALALQTRTRPLYGFGHSLGGAACLLAEEKQPGTFDALFLFEPVAAPDAQAGEPHPWDKPLSVLVKTALKRRADFPSRAAAKELYASKPPLSYLSPECLDLYVMHGFEERKGGSITLRCRPETESEIFRLGPQAGIQSQLGRVACPVTVALGGRDIHDGPASVAPAVASKVCRGKQQLFTAQGHFGPLEDPDGVAVAALACFGAHARL